MCDPTGGIATAAVVASSSAAATGGLAATATVAAAASTTAAASAAIAAGTTFSLSAGAAAAGGLSLGTLATGVSLLSGAMGAYGSYQQGQQQKAMNDYQSKVLQQQAMLAQRSADANTTIVQNQAAEQSKSVARKVATVMGAQAATAAANGTASSGTANDIALDTFDTGHLDQLAVQYNANLKTWGIQEGLHGEQWNLGVEGDQLKIAGANAEKAGFINAGASLLSTAAQVTNNKLLLNSRGVL